MEHIKLASCALFLLAGVMFTVKVFDDVKENRTGVAGIILNLLASLSWFYFAFYFTMHN